MQRATTWCAAAALVVAVLGVALQRAPQRAARPHAPVAPEAPATDPASSSALAAPRGDSGPGAQPRAAVLATSVDAPEAAGHVDRSAESSPRRTLVVSGTLETLDGSRPELARVVVERLAVRAPAGAPQGRRVHGLDVALSRDGRFEVTTTGPLELDRGSAPADGPLALRVTGTARQHRSASAPFQVGQRDVRLVLEPSGRLRVRTQCDAALVGALILHRLRDREGALHENLSRAGGTATFDELPLGPAELTVTLHPSGAVLTTLSGLIIPHGWCDDPRLAPLSLHGSLEVRAITVTCDGAPLRAEDRLTVRVIGPEGEREAAHARTTAGFSVVAVPGTALFGRVGARGYATSPEAAFTHGQRIDLRPERILEARIDALPPSPHVYVLDIEGLEPPAVRVESELALRPGSAVARLADPPVGPARARINQRSVGGVDGPGPVLVEGPWQLCSLPAPPASEVRLRLQP